MIRRLGEIAAFVILVGTILVATGVGQGSPPRTYPISQRAERSEIEAVAHGSALARHGEQLFDEHGCGDCHTMAAGGDNGRLGPRLDVASQGNTLRGIEEDITDPPRDIPGYEPGLMPENFGSRLPRSDVRALAAFIQTAAGGAAAASGPGH